MAAPLTGKYEDLVLQIEGETAGTYRKICGLKGFEVQRSTAMDEAEIPADCENEALPYVTEATPRTQSVTVTGGDATWAGQSHEMMMDWWYSGETRNIRIQHSAAAVGDTEFEAGPAYLTELGTSRTKGQKITAPITIRFAGLPTRTAKVAP